MAVAQSFCSICFLDAAADSGGSVLICDGATCRQRTHWACLLRWQSDKSSVARCCSACERAFPDPVRLLLSLYARTDSVVDLPAGFAAPCRYAVPSRADGLKMAAVCAFWMFRACTSPVSVLELVFGFTVAACVWNSTTDPAAAFARWPSVCKALHDMTVVSFVLTCVAFAGEFCDYFSL
jgi:hypothetical protein